MSARKRIRSAGQGRKAEEDRHRRRSAARRDHGHPGPEDAEARVAAAAREHGCSGRRRPVTAARCRARRAGHAGERHDARGAGGTKLVSFETFSTKDPFAAQVQRDDAGCARLPRRPRRSRRPTASKTASSTDRAGTSPATSKPDALRVRLDESVRVGPARITVNGKTRDRSPRGSTSPRPTRRSRSWRRSGTVTISIAGGSLKAGSKTFLHHDGEADDAAEHRGRTSRYTLKLVSTAPQAA